MVVLVRVEVFEPDKRVTRRGLPITRHDDALFSNLSTVIYVDSVRFRGLIGSCPFPRCSLAPGRHLISVTSPDA